MTKYRVQCYIYDLSMGMARSMSLGLIGKQIDGIWHTGIVVYGKEFFFGGGSIEQCPPGGTIMGQPQEKFDLGETEVPEEVFIDYLHDLAVTSYRADQYHLLHHNCNTFSNEVAMFLTGRGIPSHITSLPQEFMNTPFGKMVKPFIDSMSVNPGGQAHPVFTDRELSTSAQSANPTPPGAAAAKHQGAPPTAATQAAAASNLPLEPASFTADISQYHENKDKIKVSVTEDDLSLLAEVEEYLTKGDVSWAPGRAHVLVIDKLLHDSNIVDPVRASVCSLLQNLLLKKDIISMFKMDPQSKKILFKLAQATKFYTPVMQEAALKTLCNTLKEESVRNNLEIKSSQALSVQLLCDVCTSCVLSEPVDAVNDYGAVLLYTTTLCYISEEDALNLGTALVQQLTTTPDSEFAKYSVHALHNCMVKNAEVVSFAAVMELDLGIIAIEDESLADVKERIKEKLNSVRQ